jgi:pimeloyl-ACP methyl ester carboxylesterase/acyl carrier protein
MSTIQINQCQFGLIVEELVRFANQELLAGAGDVPVDADTPILEMGVLDSLSMVSLLAFIRSRMNVNVPDEEVLPENFETLGTMADLIARLRARGGRGESEEGNALSQSIRILESAGIRRRWVSVSGNAQMHALEVSGAPPVWVLLPGLGSPSSSWGTMIRTLQGQNAAIAPDLLGFGVSRAAAIAPDYSAQLAAVGALLDAIGKERLVLVGSSAGSLIATEIARALPERVAALVITGFGLVADPPAWHQMLVALASSPELFLEAAYHRPPRLTGDLRNLFQDVMRRPAYHAFLEGRGLQAMSRAFEGLHLPTLFVAGQQDRIIPPEAVRAAAERIPGARIEWLARCGHFPPAEQPEELVFVIRSFLKSLKLE